MRARVVYSDFIAHMKTWYRSKGTVFWALAFPIMLMVIFGAIFAATFDVKLTLHVQDLDNSTTSGAVVESLSAAADVKTVPPGEDIHTYISDKGARAALVIPEGFENSIAMSSAGGGGMTNFTLFLDPSQQAVNGALRSIVGSVSGGLNAEIIQRAYPGAHDTVFVSESKITQEDFEFIDYFLPGVIGITILSSTVYGTIFRNTKYREDGILRKLTTTPMRRSEWLFAMMLFMTFTSLVSTGVIILVGMLVFGVTVSLHPLFLVIVLSAAFAFAGIGMIISRFVHEEETADTAGGAITFPMIFLAGTFYPLDTLPAYLQTVARALPLYYVNEGLRDTMIFGDLEGAIANAGVVLGLAAIFFVAGILLTKWKE